MDSRKGLYALPKAVMLTTKSNVHQPGLTKGRQADLGEEKGFVGCIAVTVEQVSSPAGKNSGFVSAK